MGRWSAGSRGLARGRLVALARDPSWLGPFRRVLEPPWRVDLRGATSPRSVVVGASAVILAARERERGRPRWTFLLSRLPEEIPVVGFGSWSPAWPEWEAFALHVPRGAADAEIEVAIEKAAVVSPLWSVLERVSSPVHLPCPILRRSLERGLLTILPLIVEEVPPLERRSLTVRGMAELAGCSTRHLQRAAQTASLRLARFMRVAVVVEAQHWRRLGVEWSTTAERLGFARSNFSHFIRRTVGFSPRELDALGRKAMDSLLEQLRDAGPGLV